MKLLTKWFVQQNMSNSYFTALRDACAASERECEGFTLIPFSDELPPLDLREPSVLMGSTTLHRVCDTDQYRNYLFFDKENFKPSVYLSHHGSHMLNPDLQVVKIEDVPSLGFNPDDEVFIRSNDDSKQVSGGVTTFQSLLDISVNTGTHYIDGDLVTPETELVVASVKDLLTEYRLVFLEGQLIGSSRYRPTIEFDVPDTVKQFGIERASTWTPAPVCVMDLCETPDDGVKLIEFNSFNGSGFYKCDLPSIVHSVSRYLEV
jgi:hypothetical protein